jgi:hypothetical protein
MRIAALAAALLLAAACSVELEGARCDTTEQCPADQACGNDRRCSVRAARCERCGAGELRCSKRADAIETCLGDDPVCGKWVASSSCGPLVCAQDGAAAPACVCTPPATDVYVDPVAGESNAAVVATGAPEPPECRFRTLTAALANAPPAATVHAIGTPPVVFGADETFPLTIPSGVTLAGAADDGAVEAFRIARDAADASNPVVRLEAGATLQGFTIASATATAPVVDLACTGSGIAALRTSVVDGGASSRAGVVVSGTCGVDLLDVTLRSIDGPGLDVRPSSADVVVTMLRGRVEGAKPGIFIDAGAVQVSGDDTARVEIASNSTYGVYASKRAVLPTPALHLRLDRALVESNRETGIAIKDLPAGSTVAITASEIRSNQTSTDLSLGASGRKAGGIVLWGTPPAQATFAGNLIRGNSGDEVAVLSGQPWNLSAASCDAASKNVFTCVADGEYAVVSVGSTTNAQYNDWSAVAPGSFLLGVDYTHFCGTDPGSLPDCP